MACNETIDVNSSVAISLHMTSSSRIDVTSRYPSTDCSLHIAARRGQRLGFTVFTLGGPSEVKVDSGKAWESHLGGPSAGNVSTRRPCDDRRTLFIVDGGRTSSSSLCHLPRFQSHQKLVYTSTDWRVSIYWTWTGQSSSGQLVQSEENQPFTSYILKVEGQPLFLFGSQ